MLRTRRAVAAAASIALSLGSAGVVAHADAGSTLYVDNSAPANCTDTGNGAGSAVTPFCTIQAGADAATPGETVSIAAGSYAGPVDITSSGTATAPIVFQATGDGPVEMRNPKGQAGPTLSLTGASYVQLEGFLGSGPTQRFNVEGVTVSASSHITLDSIENSGKPITLAGSSADVAVTHSILYGGIAITAGSSGDTISTNEVVGGISVYGAANTVITSNTVWGSTSPLPPDPISIGSNSTGTSIENNIAVPTQGADFGISVDSSSAAGTTADYNVVSAGALSAYSWANVSYPSQFAFTTATGRGAHDLMNAVLNPAPYTNTNTAPQVNSANSAAPGMLSTDMYGHPCTSNPLVAVTGAGSPAYCARGAAQQQYTTTVTASAAPAGALSVVLDSTMAQTSQIPGTSIAIRPAPTPAVSYTVNWGDGTTSAPTPASATDTFTAMTHAYAKMGTYTITDTAELTDGSTATTTAAVTTAGAGYSAFGPTRMLDTRHGIGTDQATVDAGTGVQLQVAGVDGIPADVTAVTMNLTVTDATGNGYLDAVPTGTSTSTSSLNYLAGQTVANNVIVPVAHGSVTIYNEGHGSADIIADVSGYFTTAKGDGYGATTLQRLLDTRNGTGAAKAKIPAKTGVPVAIAGADGIPKGVTAVAVHVTVTDTAGNGWIATEADSAGTPGTSSLNYLKGQTVSNTVIVPVAADGKIELYNGGGTTPVDLIADVSGYFAPTATAAYVPITPSRDWDSRQDYNALPANGSMPYDLDFPGYSPYTIPSDSSVITNITLTDETANGFITAYPFGTSKPVTSNLNYFKNQTIAGLSILNTTGNEGTISVYNQSPGTSDIILDVFGYFANS